MTDKKHPMFARPAKYTIQKEDIIGMMRSGLPGEIVEARMVRLKTTNVLGWEIEVVRPLYGEEYVMHSFVSLAMVSEGPEWVDEQHRIIDKAFEAARKEHPKAMH